MLIMFDYAILKMQQYLQCLKDEEKTKNLAWFTFLKYISG